MGRTLQFDLFIRRAFHDGCIFPLTTTSGSARPRKTITINNVALKVVEKFCYLGSNVTASGSLVSELDARIGKAASTFGKLCSRVWANQHLLIHVKIRIYVACMLSMLLCGCETWSTYRCQEKRLNAFRFRCLWSILDVSWRDRIPNTTIMERTAAPDIFSLLRIYRLRWSGHVCRMEDDRLPKDILCGQLPSAPRPVSHPKLRYKEVLKRNLKALNINTEKYGKLVTINTGACFLALPSTKTDEHIRYHRLQSSPNWSSNTQGKAVERDSVLRFIQSTVASKMYWMVSLK